MVGLAFNSLNEGRSKKTLLPLVAQQLLRLFAFRAACQSSTEGDISLKYSIFLSFFFYSGDFSQFCWAEFRSRLISAGEIAAFEGNNNLPDLFVSVLIDFYQEGITDTFFFFFSAHKAEIK